MKYRENVMLSKEIRDLLLADATLTFAFTFAFFGGVSSLFTTPGVFLYFLPISLIAVSFTFVLHELMHKFVAQHFGAIAGFKTYNTGLIITLISGLMGFLIGIPGATVIYASSFTKKEEGIVSLAGPLTNFAIFVIAAIIGSSMYPHFLGNVSSTLSLQGFTTNSYLKNILNMTLLISIVLAFFNMLPIYPLDGSKVFAWNKEVYIVTILVIFGLLVLVLPGIVASLAFMLLFALIFSMFYRSIMVF